MPKEGLDYKILLIELKKIVKPDQFRIQYPKKNVKIFGKDMESYEKLKHALKETETPFLRKQRNRSK